MIQITLDQRPYLSLNPPCITLIAETRCGVCDTRLGVTSVEREKDFRADIEYATRLKAEVIESLLWALAEHEKENHAVQPHE